MSLIETTKIAYELAKKAANIELQEKLMEMREQALELQEENVALKKRIGALEEHLAMRDKIIWDEVKQVYWLGVEKKDGPYCPHCWDANGTLIRLQQFTTVRGGQRRYEWTCQACKNYFLERQ